MIASSAARWSSRRRCVSSNRRAFSSATLRLPAIVVSRRTSASLNACSRSRFWSEMTPGRLAARDQRDEEHGSRRLTLEHGGLPDLGHALLEFSLTTSGSRVSTTCLPEAL